MNTQIKWAIKKWKTIRNVEDRETNRSASYCVTSATRKCKHGLAEYKSICNKRKHDSACTHVHTDIANKRVGRPTWCMPDEIARSQKRTNGQRQWKNRKLTELREKCVRRTINWSHSNSNNHQHASGSYKSQARSENSNVDASATWSLPNDTMK